MLLQGDSASPHCVFEPSAAHALICCAIRCSCVVAQVPGQFVGVRLPGQGTGLGDNQQLYSIACSPYDSRKESAYISGSIIEVCVGLGL